MLSDEHAISPEPMFGVSDAIALFNQMLETATPHITVVGEVANFKINQGKWVFFDIKDEESTLGCFMSAFNLRVAIEDGMKVVVTARPNLTRWGKFSLTIQTIRPVGEGSIRRSFELLRAKLEQEGLFSPERKRNLPTMPQVIGVISSTQAAGYADFIKIIGERYAGLAIQVANVPVQGEMAAPQMIAALDYFNELAEPPEAIALLRGGGSRDDLVAFDDEPLVRAIARSRVPVITGVGHEVDVTLADLVADVRAATPSNAAQLLVPSRQEILARVDSELKRVLARSERGLDELAGKVESDHATMLATIESSFSDLTRRYDTLRQVLRQVDPRLVLNRGYALVRDEAGRNLQTRPNTGDNLTVETAQFIIETEVKNARQK